MSANITIKEETFQFIQEAQLSETKSNSKMRQWPQFWYQYLSIDIKGH